MVSPANQVGRAARVVPAQAGHHAGGGDGGGGGGSAPAWLLAGRYEVGPRIGRGAEGDIFRALDRRSEAPVALKVFHQGGSAATGARVAAEFQRLAELDHPGLVRALDLGRDQGRLFLVTELLEGESVSAIAAVADEVRRRDLFARAAREIADALAYLHARGFVHGDVSPANVRIDSASGRAVLIDLGAAGLRSVGAATGTLGYAAPESLIGVLGPAGDLFSLGATLFHAWSGSGPFGAGAEAVGKMLSGPAPRLSSVRAGLPAVWDDVIAALLRSVPEERLRSARGLLRTLAHLDPVATGSAAVLLPPHPAGDPLAGIFVGRARERTLLKDLFAALAEGAAAHAAVALVGSEGSGRGALATVALRDLAIAQIREGEPPVRVFRGGLAALAVWLAVEPLADRIPADEDPIREQQRLFARVLMALDERARETPLVVSLAAGLTEAAFAAFVAGAPPSGRCLVLAAVERSLGRVASLDLPLAPLARSEIEALLAAAAGDEPPSQAVARVMEASGGHPATVAVLARQLIEAMRCGDAATFAPRLDQALDGWLTQSFERLPAPARRLVAVAGLGLPRAALVAGWTPPASPALIGDGGPRSDETFFVAEMEALTAGWLVKAPSTDEIPWAAVAGTPALGGEETEDAALAVLRLPSDAHRTVLRRALRHGDVVAVARRALALPGVLPSGARGFCLESVGRPREAVDAFLAAAAEQAEAKPARGAGISGAEWLAEAARLAPARLDARQRANLATALLMQGRAAESLALLDQGPSGPTAGTNDAAPALDAGGHLSLTERKAWVLARGGRLEPARALLEQAIAAAPAQAPPEALDLVRARLARVLVSLGRFPEAVAAAARCLAHGGGGALAIESAILAHAYAGDLGQARAVLAGWTSTEGPRASAPAQASAARIGYLTALLDQLSGQLQRALDGYRQALARAEGEGDIHTVAAIALNMGALAAESGQYEQALKMQDRAIHELGRLGSTPELATALFNAGMTLIDLGDGAAARAVIARMRREGAGLASAGPDPTLDGPAPGSVHVAGDTAAVTYLQAELALRAGDQAAALDLFARAAVAGGLDRAVGRAARLARAELLGRARHTAEAELILDELTGPTGEGIEDAAADLAGSGDLRLARGRVLLDAPALEADRALKLAADLLQDAELAARDGRRPRAWRAALTAARLFHRGGQTARASGAMASAARFWEEIRMNTPIDHHPGLEQDPDARFMKDLARLSGAAGGGGAALQAEDRGGRGGRSEDRLRRLLRINKRLNSELRLPRLLELIMDTIIELTEAERGFILLEDDKGELAVKVARNIDQQSLESGAFDLSRSIARQAATGGSPVVTIDAAGDPRFREALSVSDLHLRSVLAVPLQAKGRAVGTLYVDNRLRRGAFGEDDVQLVVDFAEQAGIAIENARLLSELRRRERQVEVLNRRLQGELAVRKEELVGMKQELRENREALAIRYDYRNIIGRTPRMLDLFRLLDRLTDTALPVVIQGESGTGKELVARALHFNGPRRNKPFVSENCAAIPETLLESTLFGAVRGAYTGADHDSRGLFEVADGGTLFLDEVGEMSPAMQGKLLRILQTGELRRVGSERTRTVDVRVIAATNRDLGRMVEEGRFRQDLFFRLSVAPIALPPLRERREDIPAIVEHVFAKLAAAAAGPGPAKRLTPAALARLMSYRWPGNVRELENELRRALAMSDGNIEVRDLSPHVAGDAESALTALDDPDNLALRPRVERLERALLREALSRCGGNQTRAAGVLGLSRFGLQKKIQRYRLG